MEANHQVQKHKNGVLNGVLYGFINHSISAKQVPSTSSKGWALLNLWIWTHKIHTLCFFCFCSTKHNRGISSTCHKSHKESCTYDTCQSQTHDFMVFFDRIPAAERFVTSRHLGSLARIPWGEALGWQKIRWQIWRNLFIESQVLHLMFQVIFGYVSHELQ